MAFTPRSKWGALTGHEAVRRVSRTPLQVGYSEACELFAIACARFRPAVEVTLQQAAPAVVRIDLGVPRPIHRPGGLRGVLQDDFVDHTHSLQRPNPVAANSRRSGTFPDFPDSRRREEAQDALTCARVRAAPALQALASAGPSGCKVVVVGVAAVGLRTGASRAVSGGEDSMARAARAAATIASFSRYR